MYVLFEGIDGCGKSTQIEILKDRFDIVATKEPGGTEFGKMARQMLLHSDIKSKKAELLLFLADRAEHFKEVVEPNLNKVVVSDRGFVSGIAYALMGGFELDLLIELNKFALDNYLPQKVVLFEITKDELLNRISQREQDKIESRGVEYLLDIQNNMKEIVEKLNLDYILMDATKDISVIHQEIVDYLNVGGKENYKLFFC